MLHIMCADTRQVAPNFIWCEALALAVEGAVLRWACCDAVAVAVGRRVLFVRGSVSE
jgi:hypothetical protein